MTAKKKSLNKSTGKNPYEDVEPFYFIKNILGVKYLTPDQRMMVESVWKNKYTGVQAAHSVGKTFLEACITLTFLITNTDSIVVTTAPTSRQVRDLLWTEINSLYARAKKELPGEMKLMNYTIDSRWFATGIATESGKEEQSAVKFQGYHADKILVICDEAVGIHPAIWEAIDGITNSVNAKVLAVGNPSMINCSFKKHIDSYEWKKLKVTALNHPNVIRKRTVIPGAVSYRWVKDKIKKWCKETAGHDESLNTFDFEGKIYVPNTLFLWKILGEFPEENTDALIPPYKVQEAMQRSKEQIAKSNDDDPDSQNCISDESRFCYMAVDVARFGMDESVFAICRNNEFITKNFKGLDTMKITGQAMDYIKLYKPSKVGVDSDGIGAGVFDKLKENRESDDAIDELKNVELIEIHSGANPLQLGQTEEFLNLRAQMYWMFKQDIGSISLEPDDEMLDALSSIKYYFNSKGKIQIEPKEEIKRRLGRSPDAEDALVYCNFLKYMNTRYAGTMEDGGEEKYVPITEKIGI
jgi:phage terminase large subunit